MALRVDGRMGKLYLVEFAQPKSVINFVTQNVARPWVIVVVEGVTDPRWPGESLNWLVPAVIKPTMPSNLSPPLAAWSKAVLPTLIMTWMTAP